jgi:hypothetical protein
MPCSPLKFIRCIGEIYRVHLQDSRIRETSVKQVANRASRWFLAEDEAEMFIRKVFGTSKDYTVYYGRR